jgi:LysR family glycine cleavage system transcriptional activator
VFPVCAPDYAKRLGDDAQQFPQGEPDLVAQEVPERSWFTWNDWFLRAGLAAHKKPPSLQFQHYTEVLEAARAGHGVALGWGMLVQHYLQDGSLVRLGERSVQAEGRYNVVVPWQQKSNPARAVLIEWLADCLSRK